MRAAEDEGLALHVGCMTLDVEVLARYLDRAASIPGAEAVRIVLEDESGQAPARTRLEQFLASAAVRAQDARMTLVLENHFHVPCRVLRELATVYPPETMAFCVDSANSLRNWESAAQVFDLLDERAAFYHLKDYCVRGSNVGFEVTGAPLGEGALDLDVLSRANARPAHQAAGVPGDVGADDGQPPGRHGHGSRVAGAIACGHADAQPTTSLDVAPRGSLLGRSGIGCWSYLVLTTGPAKAAPGLQPGQRGPGAGLRPAPHHQHKTCVYGSPFFTPMPPTSE